MEEKQILAIVVILMVAGSVGVFLYMQQSVLAEEIPQATMTAEGQFDRIELVDRHYGDWNGQEVEGILLAVLYTNGTTNITQKHYEGPFTETYTSFCFFLYIYQGTEHLRERISIMGGDVELYYYLNITITISLDMTIS